LGKPQFHSPFQFEQAEWTTGGYTHKRSAPSKAPSPGDRALSNGDRGNSLTLMGWSSPRGFSTETLWGDILLGNQAPPGLPRRTLKLAPLGTSFSSNRFQAPFGWLGHPGATVDMCSRGGTTPIVGSTLS